MVQAHIIYSGAVQGVGFRYTVQRCAVSRDLTGWVKNCTNGSVEVLVSGSKEDIEKLCQNVEEYFSDNIRNKDIRYTSPLKEFKDFQITY